jgi:hypothetical protein
MSLRSFLFLSFLHRLLSSYLHLIKSPNSLKRYKTMFYQRNLSTTWDDFLQISLETNGIQNIHWNPQTNFCGFRKFWPLFTFVGNYELIQRDHGRILSQQAGLNNFSKTLPLLISFLPLPYLFFSFPLHSLVSTITSVTYCSSLILLLLLSLVSALQGWSLTKNMKYMNEKRKGAKVKYQIPSEYNHGDCLWCRNHAPHKVCSLSPLLLLFLFLISLSLPTHLTISSSSCLYPTNSLCLVYLACLAWIE